MTGKLVLILGGVRSGKSRFAQELAEQIGGDDVLFVATAEPLDDEMTRRIDIHRTSRRAGWQTMELPLQLGNELLKRGPTQKVIVIDCLTLLVSNVLLSCWESPAPEVAERAINNEVSTLLDACQMLSGTIIFVSGEVGSGVVPDFPLGRLFRDLLGWVNQTIARHSSATYLLVAGLPIEVKSLAVSLEQAVQNLRNDDSL